MNADAVATGWFRQLAVPVVLVACTGVLAQESVTRLESASEAGANCFEQIRKTKQLEFDPKSGLTAGVDNTDASENSSLYLRMRFPAPDAPPSVEILYAAGASPQLRRAVERAVLNYRLSCLPAGEREVVVTQRFIVRGYEAPWPRLKQELTLVELLRLVKKDDTKGIRFDFTAMACPFKVEFAPYRPYASNSLKEVGGVSPTRSAFLAWLREAMLDLPPKFMRTAMGETSVISVPCTVLDLS